MDDGEKQFLHDIASPLMVAISSLDTALSIVNRAKLEDPKLLERLKLVEASLEKITAHLKARRSLINKS